MFNIDDDAFDNTPLTEKEIRSAKITAAVIIAVLAALVLTNFLP